MASLVLLGTALSEVAPSQAADKQKIVRQVAEKWIQVGNEQYQRGFYKAAEQSFLRAQDYQEYLTASERSNLQALLEKSHIAAIEKDRVTDHIRKANELIETDELAEAKVHLEAVKDSEYLTQQERQLVQEALRQVNNRLSSEQKKVNTLYNRSVEFYKAGQFDQAREGFLQLIGNPLLDVPEGQTPEDYLVKIDGALARQAEEAIRIVLPTEPAAPAEPQVAPAPPAAKPVTEAPVVEVPAETALPTAIEQRQVVTGPVTEIQVTGPAPVAAEGGYVEVINRRRNILRSHTSAVVNDAVNKAEVHIDNGDLDAAREAIGEAERLVNDNHLHLGDEVFNQYTDQLITLSERIAKLKAEQVQTLEEQRRADAIEAQRVYRDQMELDRSRRIEELMTNAIAYQKQQRYEEALGQLESLIAIDPLNDKALTLKQTLKDIISFREQLEMERKSRKERMDILLKTDEAAIPYADEVTYPKNWREISASPFRKPEEAIGQNAADGAVYDQLNEIVDLSALTLETPLEEAINELRNAVDPPLKIVVMWRDLYDNADIDQTTPINIDAISAVTLGTALDLILKSVSGGFTELGYTVENGVITIATRESLPQRLETKVYDVTDLLMRPANYRASTRSSGAGGAGGDVSTVGGGFEDDEEDQVSTQELAGEATGRASNLIFLIQDTVEPDSWFENGGEGSVTVYENRKLVVMQTREIHRKIDDVLNNLRKSLGHQVAIEARFLVVGENFLEEIGLDIDFIYNFGGKVGQVTFFQSHAGSAVADTTGVPGSLGGAQNAMSVFGTYGSMLDDLQVQFLLNATQGHRDSQTLTAPKATVLSGESAALRVQKNLYYAGDIEVDTRESGDVGRTSFNVNYEDRSVISGTILNVTPTIMPDKKHVLLDITAELRDFLGFRTQTVDVPVFGDVPTAGGEYSIEFPETEVSRIQTRVSMPDGGTLLLGGQKLSAEIEKQAGVPILSKIPIIGRAFANKSVVKDKKVLLVLVKPTIILQEESEAKAVAGMENVF